MTATDRLLVWLREAMDATSRDAEAAARAFPDWEFDDCVKEVRDVPNSGTVASIAVPEFGPHIARQSPAAVLRRITADRQLLELHAQPHECVSYDWVSKEINPCMWVDADETCTTLRLLAEGYGWTEEATP